MPLVSPYPGSPCSYGRNTRAVFPDPFRSRIRYLDEHLPVLGVGRYGNDSFLGMFDGIMQ